MQLFGIYLSPYVRRVAISLTQLGIPFEHHPVKIFETPDVVRTHNPMARVPTMVLDDGDVLVESSAILDEINQMVAPDKGLVPESGPQRRRVLQITAYGTAIMEKAQWAFYEYRFHPEEKFHQPWVDHNDAQVIDGLKHLDGIAAAAGETGWLAGTDTISQADITATVTLTFVRAVRSNLDVEAIAPALCEFAERCEALPAFDACALPG